MDAIKITKLKKVYDRVTAVNGISFSIKQGEIFALLGPNGAGKTTTLMMLSTLLRPTSGKAVIHGFDVMTQPSQVRSSIGMVFQDPSSDDILTGYENLKLHALMYDLPLKDIDRKIDEVLSLVDLVDRKNDLVHAYSGGMRRRLEIARGLLHAPKILFLDEPTLGLDPQTRQHIWTYIENLAKTRGMTIILTTHYMEEAEKLCDRIAIIDHGKIVALDTPQNLRSTLAGDVVLLRGDSVNVEQLKKLPCVKKIEREDHVVKLSVENAGKDLQEVLQMTGPVDSVEVHSPDLNDVFLHYTGGQMRSEEGGEMEYLRAVTNVRNAK